MREHNTSLYMTSNHFFISFLKGSDGPLPSQIFTAVQNPDCTWSFKDNKGKYISLDTNQPYIMLVDRLGMKERFYMERKGAWIYLQSALSYRYFVTVGSSLGMFEANRASRFVMEVWPELENGWN